MGSRKLVKMGIVSSVHLSKTRPRPTTRTSSAILPTLLFILCENQHIPLNIRHYLAVPPGPHLLSSMILNSPILAGDRNIPDELAAAGPSGVGGAAAGGAGPSQFEFGVDPSLDPELAMVRFPKKKITLMQLKKKFMFSFFFLGPADVYGRGSCETGSCQPPTCTSTVCDRRPHSNRSIGIRRRRFG